MRPACADRGCQPEEKWYALTGRVVDAKVEADGDIHIALEVVAILDGKLMDADALRTAGGFSGLPK